MSRKQRQPRMVVRLARLHARLLISAAVGVAAMLTLYAADWRLATKLLIGWDTGVALYLALTYWMMSHALVSHIRRRAAQQDEGAIALLGLTAAAAIASLAAIIVEVGGAKNGNAWGGLALGMGTILLSWLFMHTIFALHYAHEYYGEGRDATIGGLEFPGDQNPDHWDFVYFSFVIAMTSQVSDVQITSKGIRRLVNAHGVLSFFFNVVLLALTINMVSGVINPG